MKPITFTTSILSVTILGAALLALGSIGFSSTPGEMSKIAYTGNLWCVSNLVQETDASGSLVYADSGLAKNDPRLKGKESLIRREQVTGETQEEVETKATKAGLWEKSNKDELRAALDKKNAEGDNFYTHHFNQGATHPGPCVGSGTGEQEGLWINDAINQECFEIKTSSDKQSVYNPNAFSAEQINAYLTKKYPKSPLNGMGSAFVAAAQKHGVNAGILLGIANAESSLGIQCETSKTPAPKGLGGSKNAFGLTTSGQGTFITFSSYEEGIDRAAANLASSKYKSLQSIKEIRLKWCGFERESENSGVKLSDGTVITYACENNGSSWEQEVMAVVNNLIADNPVTTLSTGNTKKTIAIDPGHGSAANSNAPHEGPIELATGLKLASDLRAEGYNVVMTHTAIGEVIGGVKSDANQDNIARAKIANSSNADLTIRLHANDTTSSKFMAIYPSKAGTDVTGHTGPANPAVLSGSKTLADDVTSAMDSSGFSGSPQTESSSTGRDSLIFSTYTNSPVVTLELYGYNSTSLVAKYKDPATQAQVAAALTKAVDTYEGTNKPITTNPASGTPTLVAGASPKCPPTPLKVGPSEGEDYQMQIAHQINLINNAKNDAAAANASSVGPLPPVTNNIAKVAEGEVGYPGELCPNGTHDKTKYDGCEQWCAYFATWVIKQAGINIPSIGGSREVYNWYKSGHHVFTDPALAGEGDVVVWKRDSEHGHVGIVIQNDQANKTLTVVEGNTTHDIVKAYSYSYGAVVNRGDGLSLLGFGRL